MHHSFRTLVPNYRLLVGPTGRKVVSNLFRLHPTRFGDSVPRPCRIPGFDIFHLLPYIFDGRTRCSAPMCRRGIVRAFGFISTVHANFIGVSRGSTACLPNALFQVLDGPEKPVDNVGLVVDLGLKDGIVSSLIEYGNIGPGLHQQLYAFEVTVECSPMQWSIARLIDSIDDGWGGADGNEQLDDVWGYVNGAQ